ncbi:MAG: DNA alkylation repair protein [Bryobacteraceae bacterium]|nr:DNA alkylation repair protein [Bryobacteraceae bacterium]
MRPAIVVEPLVAVEVLSSWSESPAAFRRRFASEATRPRGVWCGHIELFKADPSLALPLLEPLRADPEKYVQDSVGNWLNDAAKSQPDWVRSLCRSWTRHRPPAAATTKICKRALRSLS